jgi:translation initiation factor 1
VNNSRPVYSSDGGRIDRPLASRPAKAAAHPPSAPAVPQDGIVRLFRERGGRGGKTVTVVRGLPERGAKLEALATELKRFCGAGGTLRDGAIEIQGEHRERLAQRLRDLGYNVKIAGG